MRKIYLYSTLLIAIAVGCTDLTEDVYSGIEDSNFPETDAQANVSHLIAYKDLRGLYDDNGYVFLTQEITSDEMVAPTRGADWYDGGKWLALQYHSWSNSDDAVNSMWRQLYQGVGESNKVVDKLHKVKSTDATKKLLAEVETIRSLYYYWLLDNYRDIPYLTSYSSAPSEPFRTSGALVFDSLTTTLEANYPLLHSIKNPVYKKFASKEMAWALLAKLYLNGSVYTGKPYSDCNEYYKKTIQYCDLLLNCGYLSLEPEVMNLFKVATSGSSAEMIFIVPFDEISNTGFRLHMRSLSYVSKQTFNMNDQPWNGFAVIPTFLDKYDAADKRKKGYMLYGDQIDFKGDPIMDKKKGSQVTFDPQIKFPEMSTENMEAEGIDNFEMSNSGARVQKYEIYEGAKENLIVNFPVFRLADIVFMKAEAELRLGKSVSSTTLINTIGTRAGVTIPPLTIENILDERGKELFCEGHRRNDMIRLGTFSKPFWAMNDGKTGVQAPNSVQDYFPVPQGALDSNPNLGGAIIGK